MQQFHETRSHRGLAVSVKKKKGLRLEFDRFTQCLFGAIIRLESPFRASGEILCRSNAVPSDGIHGKRPGDRASAAWTTTKRRCSPDIPALPHLPASRGPNQAVPFRVPSRIVVLCSFRVVSTRVQPCPPSYPCLTIPPPLVDLGDCRDFYAVLTPCALLCRREACAWEPRGLGGALRRLRCLRTKDFPLPHPIFTIATVPLTLPPLMYHDSPCLCRRRYAHSHRREHGRRAGAPAQGGVGLRGTGGWLLHAGLGEYRCWRNRAASASVGQYY